ncbi:hypothetical protein POKO110462_00235 [Pontibacter korlensis]|uniref:Glycosyltransferase RgtA/B/C/D-like domain-containing protein n=1 Tax=Pontibacter korlensis TaxID=400092 RepID=A0A0E3UVS0_9BACT|nr:hypothetical protein [Pontibacter korlensis]AKD02722.1 hypothetical protein PKOR_05770 [Pontibacter korlensis]
MQKLTNQKSLYKADLLLLLLYVATAVIILFRISVEGTGYLSPDSKAYLGLAQNLKDGYGFYVLNSDGTGRHYFSTWPVGYPVLIYLFSELTTISIYWSSKVLNLLLLAGGFALFRQLNRQYSYLLASVYGAYTFMEVYSFTWSEAPFLLCLLLLAHLVYKVWEQQDVYRNTVFIFLLCLTLFLLRYVGAFSFGVPVLLGLYYGYRQNVRAAIVLLVSAVLLTILAGAYLYTNYALSGFTTGFDRLEAETENAGSFVQMLLRGLLNEFLIIREYRPANQPDYLLYVTAALQLLVLFYICFTINRHFNFWQAFKKNKFAVACAGIASLYLMAILALRTLSHFDDLDYRLLSPFSFLVFISLIHTFSLLPNTHKEVVRAKYVLFGFFVISLLLNVPKKFVVSQLQLLF